MQTSIKYNYRVHGYETPSGFVDFTDHDEAIEAAIKLANDDHAGIVWVEESRTIYYFNKSTGEQSQVGIIGGQAYAPKKTEMRHVHVTHNGSLLCAIGCPSFPHDHLVYDAAG